jgi:hypothetical protein
MGTQTATGDNRREMKRVAGAAALVAVTAIAGLAASFAAGTVPSPRPSPSAARPTHPSVHQIPVKVLRTLRGGPPHGCTIRFFRDSLASPPVAVSRCPAAPAPGRTHKDS